MKYLHFNEQNELIARYDSAVHDVGIPENAVETADELFLQTINETDGVWKRDPQTGNISKEPLPAPTSEQLAESARIDRDALLSVSDWVVIRAQELGEPVPQEWAVYRQALRDVPQQAGFPSSITWPIEPAPAV